MILPRPDTSLCPLDGYQPNSAWLLCSLSAVLLSHGPRPDRSPSHMSTYCSLENLTFSTRHASAHTAMHSPRLLPTHLYASLCYSLSPLPSPPAPSAVFASTRWVPVVKDIMESLLENKVDRTYINYVRDAPTKGGAAASAAPVSARSKPGWASRDKKDKAKASGVCLVFSSGFPALMGNAVELAMCTRPLEIRIMLLCRKRGRRNASSGAPLVCARPAVSRNSLVGALENIVGMVMLSLKMKVEVRFSQVEVRFSLRWRLRLPPARFRDLVPGPAADSVHPGRPDLLRDGRRLRVHQAVQQTSRDRYLRVFECECACARARALRVVESPPLEYVGFLSFWRGDSPVAVPDCDPATVVPWQPHREWKAGPYSRRSCAYAFRVWKIRKSFTLLLTPDPTNLSPTHVSARRRVQPSARAQDVHL